MDYTLEDRLEGFIKLVEGRFAQYGPVLDEKSYKKQLEKWRLYSEHLMFQDDVKKLRHSVGLPEAGLKSKEIRKKLKEVDRGRLIDEVLGLMERCRISERWFEVVLHFVLMPEADLPRQIVPVPIDFYVSPDRQTLNVKIYKDTTKADFNVAWEEIEKQQRLLLPEIKSRSKKRHEVLILAKGKDPGAVTVSRAVLNKDLKNIYLRGRIIEENPHMSHSELGKLIKAKTKTKIKEKDVLSRTEINDIKRQYRDIFSRLFLS